MLAIAGLFSTRRRTAVAASIVVLLSADLSLGLNGLLYPRLLDWWPALHGLRVPARYALFVLAGLAILAALGCERLGERAARSGRGTALIAAAAIVIACVEYRSPQRHLLGVDMHPAVYRFLSQLPDGTSSNLPLPERSGSVGLDADYMDWSTQHWRTLINGYSGYYPPSYETTLQRLRSLPDEDSLSLLRERQVRYILVHQAFLEPGDGDLMQPTSDLTGAAAPRHLYGLGGPTTVFELIR